MKFLTTAFLTLFFVLAVTVSCMATPPGPQKPPPQQHVVPTCKAGSHWDPNAGKAGKCVPDLEKAHKVNPPLEKTKKVPE